jgi:hypothetical protein
MEALGCSETLVTRYNTAVENPKPHAPPAPPDVSRGLGKATLTPSRRYLRHFAVTTGKCFSPNRKEQTAGCGLVPTMANLHQQVVRATNL